MYVCSTVHVYMQLHVTHSGWVPMMAACMCMHVMPACMCMHAHTNTNRAYMHRSYSHTHTYHAPQATCFSDTKISAIF